MPNPLKQILLEIDEVEKHAILYADSTGKRSYDLGERLLNKPGEKPKKEPVSNAIIRDYERMQTDQTRLTEKCLEIGEQYEGKLTVQDKLMIHIIDQKSQNIDCCLLLIEEAIVRVQEEEKESKINTHKP